MPVATPGNGNPTIHLSKIDNESPDLPRSGLFYCTGIAAGRLCLERPVCCHPPARLGRTYGTGYAPTPMATSLGRYLPEQMVLKIMLAGSDPRIWRRVEVHSGLTLHDLHCVIQNVFEWEDAHLYQFLVPPHGKLTRAAMRDAVRYHVMPPDPIFADEMNQDRRADEQRVGRVFTDDCKTIVYEYDFGDSWEHVIKLEKRTRGGDEDHVPA